MDGKKMNMVCGCATKMPPPALPSWGLKLQTRRLDYTEDCKRLDAKIAELEEQLAAMTDERDSESRWAKHYSDKVTELEQQLAAKQRIIDSYRRMI